MLYCSNEAGALRQFAPAAFLTQVKPCHCIPSQCDPAGLGKRKMPAQPRQRPRPRLLTTGGLKGWQYGVLVVSCVGSMLAGASVVHTYFRPDLVRQETTNVLYNYLASLRLPQLRPSRGDQSSGYEVASLVLNDTAGLRRSQQFSLEQTANPLLFLLVLVLLVLFQLPKWHLRWPTASVVEAATKLTSPSVAKTKHTL